MTLMEMRSYPDFLTMSASTHVQSEPSRLCNRLEALIPWQAALISALPPTEVCSRDPAPQQHGITRDQWEGVACSKASVQRGDTINTVLSGLFTLISS